MISGVAAVMLAYAAGPTVDMQDHVAATAASPRAAAAPADTVSPGGDRIPARTIVAIEIMDTVTSKTAVIGDTLALRLSAPLVIDGRTILPAGLVGRGEVTHAAKGGWGGKAGELIVNARYLQCGDRRIPLGHLHYSVNGKSNVGGAFATAMIIPFGQFLVSGGEAVIPAGASGTAQVNEDVVLPAETTGRCTQTGG